MLLRDLQNGKMSFCPIAFVSLDNHISEVKYEEKKKQKKHHIWLLKKQKGERSVLLSFALNEWHLQIKKMYIAENIDQPAKIFVCHHTEKTF